MSETDYIEKVLSTLAHGQVPQAADVTAALDQRRRETAQLSQRDSKIPQPLSHWFHWR